MKKILFSFFGFIFLLTALYFFLDYSNKVKIQYTLYKIFQKITLKKQAYQNLQKKLDENIVISKSGELELKFIELEKKDVNKPLGYVEIIKKNIIYLDAGNRDLILIDENFSKKKIKNNLNNYLNSEIKKDELYITWLINPVRDILYHDEFLYVVINDVNLINDDISFSSVVLKAKFNEDYLDFKYFFKPNDEIIVKKNLAKRYSMGMHSGGRIVVDKNNNFFISIPDYSKINKVQNRDNMFGKVVQIQSLVDYKIISIGHRNPQGFYYDEEKDIFLETEHGPAGGDEINLIKPNKNYGWPIVSTGTLADNKTIKQIKFHTHKKHGYYPPLYTWRFVNPGISQITKIKKSSKFNFRNLYMVASLTGGNPYFGRHLYLFDIDNDKAILKDKIFIGDRVRDLVYDEFNDKIILVLENQESIGIIEAK